MAEPSTAWEAGKNEHRALSDAAAPIYDELYASSNPATRRYMDREIEVLKEVCRLCADTSVALDLGCGTGRDAVVLARRFDQVFGYDFSRGMIGVADSNRIRGQHGNVGYWLLDLETEPLPHRANSVGLVNTGFGMGSFLYSPEKLFREIRRVLVPQGYALFSFYNRQSYVGQLQLEWTPSLAATFNANGESLQVTLPSKETFRPSARAYSVQEVEEMLTQHFRVVRIETYPSLSGIMPATLLADPLAAELCRRVDDVLAADLQVAAGHYIIAVCQKAGKLERRSVARGYARAFELINREGLAGEIRRHAPLKTMRDAAAALADLNVSPDGMLKSILIARKVASDEEKPLQVPPMWLVVTQATRGVDFSKLAKEVDVPRRELELARLSLLQDQTGFITGAVPPFAMPKSIPVIFDHRISHLKEAWCGTGDPSQSIKIPVRTLERLATSSYRDVSKEFGSYSD